MVLVDMCEEKRQERKNTGLELTSEERPSFIYHRLCLARGLCYGAQPLALKHLLTGHFSHHATVILFLEAGTPPQAVSAWVPQAGGIVFSCNWCGAGGSLANVVS